MLADVEILIDIEIRRWKSHSPAVDDDVEMMDVGKRPQPSAPHPDFNVEEPTESNEEMRRLLTTNPMSTFQVDRPCGASPIGPHHEYYPPATIHDEIRNTNAAPAMEMPPRLFLQNNSGYNTVRPLVLRSVSDSGHSHIRLSDYRPTIIRSINSPGILINLNIYNRIMLKVYLFIFQTENVEYQVRFKIIPNYNQQKTF
jgi:hypothetical protein